MKKSVLALILTGLLFSFAGCKKYDDGPALSLMSKKARLDGNWTVSIVLNNDVDATEYYPEDYGYVFDKNGTVKKKYNQVDILGVWEFNEEKSEIRITLGASPTPEVYTILRLTNKHLWWKRVVAGDVIEEHFEIKK
jgi:hypothetical protein